MSDTPDDEVKILDHNYDGIQEFDNPLPTWWLVTFFATIIFGFHYWIHYSFVNVTGQKGELEADQAEISKLQKSAPSNEPSDDDLAKLGASTAAQAHGHEIFEAKCSVCHGVNLQGVIGPNLTDEYWIHGTGKIKEILMVVRAGVVEKGMPAWEAQLAPEDLNAVASFVVSKKGSHPAEAKAPQGNKIEK